MYGLWSLSQSFCSCLLKELLKFYLIKYQLFQIILSSSLLNGYISPHSLTLTYQLTCFGQWNVIRTYAKPELMLY